jgi:hypothetical protein
VVRRGHRFRRLGALEDEYGLDRPARRNLLTRWGESEGAALGDGPLKDWFGGRLQPTHPAGVAVGADKAGLLPERLSHPPFRSPSLPIGRKLTTGSFEGSTCCSQDGKMCSPLSAGAPQKMHERAAGLSVVSPKWPPA